VITILKGDCRDVLPRLPDNSVHCVVTSPPYWGLRDYGTAQWEGGDPDCQHKVRENQSLATSTLGGGKGTISHTQEGFKNKCPRCGAIRVDCQLGLEPDFQTYIAGMVEVFREVRRVLRPDGTLWLNLGDSYSSGGRANYGTWAPDSKQATHTAIKSAQRAPLQNGIKPKDLCGIPWRVAFALQADGWYLRSDIIWSKPNPMPESVTDRPTKAHEYIFLLSKNERYYYDAEAITEQGSGRIAGNRTPTTDREGTVKHAANGHGIFAAQQRACETRNKRSVWEISTAPFRDAHFATFPPALIEPCILAGCPKGGVVLDPFGGAGTSGLVADRLGRNAILIELNESYAEIARRRIKDDLPLFAEVE
jgi:DNA modification methylase